MSVLHRQGTQKDHSEQFNEEFFTLKVDAADFVNMEIWDLLRNYMLLYLKISKLWIKKEKINKLAQRLVLHFRKQNQKIINGESPFPNVCVILCKLGKTNYFTNTHKYKR